MKNKVILNIMSLLAIVITIVLIAAFPDIPYHYKLLPVLTGITGVCYIILKGVIGNRTMTITVGLILSLTFI